MSPSSREQTLRRAIRARHELESNRAAEPVLQFPIGLHVKDGWVREREMAIRRLLGDGVLRTADLVEAFLQTPPEKFMSKEAAAHVLAEQNADTEVEGELAIALGLRTYAMGLEALEPALGDQVVDVTARSGYLAALLSPLVGTRGRVLAIHSGADDFDAFRRSLAHLPNVDVLLADSAGVDAFEGRWDGMWIGAALPRIPKGLVQHLVDPDGRAIAFVGPRFRPQDLVSLTRHGDALEERRVARVQVPVLAGPGGWVAAPRPTPAAPRAMP